MKKSLLLMFTILIISSCGRKEQLENVYSLSKSRLKTVYTVNYPLQYFAQSIAGNKVNIVFPMKAAGDPAFWQPPEQVILEYQKADLILLNGANYAKWQKTASLPMSKLVNTSKAFNSDYIKIKKLDLSKIEEKVFILNIKADIVSEKEKLIGRLNSVISG